jgi:putative ABC transport system permease protein
VFPLISVRQFFRDMRNQKLRTLMTMFGILWGTMSVVLLMGFGTGLHEYQTKRFRGLGQNIVLIWPSRTSKPWKGFQRGRWIQFTEDDIARMKATLPSLKSISPEYRRWSVPLKTGRTNKLAYVAGVWPEFGEMRNIIPQEGGRFINPFDMAEKRRVIFLGNQLAEDLYGSTDIVGRPLFVNGVPFTIIGVMKPKEQSSSYSGRDSRLSWIPSSTFKTMWSYRYANMIIAEATGVHTAPGLIRDIRGFLATKYKFDPEDTEALMIWDTTETFKFFATFFLAFRAFLVGIGCMTLITGGIGVTNIMNVVLEERTKEIGVKMAVGARKSTIMLQFLFETGILTIIGGSLGFLLAVLIIWAYPASLVEFLGMPEVNIYGALFAVVILGVVALVSGIFPARKAANLEPVKALKLF